MLHNLNTVRLLKDLAVLIISVSGMLSGLGSHQRTYPPQSFISATVGCHGVQYIHNKLIELPPLLSPCPPSSSPPLPHV